MTTAQESGTYLYAVAAGIRSPDLLGNLTGVRGSKVYTVADQGLTAVVSDVPTREELRPERRNMAAHQEVLGKATQASRVVLPVAFGTIAESAEGVRGLLARYHDDLESQLRRLEGKRQMNVQLTYGGTASIYEYLVEQDPELRRARDELRDAGDAASRELKIDVGQRFEAALNAMRDQYGQELEDLIRTACAEFKRLPPRSEKEMARLACLVDQQQEDGWHALVLQAGAKLPDIFTLEESGPFAPYDFVELHLQA
jgi:hypothetical protein